MAGHVSFLYCNTDLLVHLQPGHCVLDVIAQTKKPRLPQSQSSAHQVKKVFPFPLDLKYSMLHFQTNFPENTNRYLLQTDQCLILNVLARYPNKLKLESKRESKFTFSSELPQRCMDQGLRLKLDSFCLRAKSWVQARVLNSRLAWRELNPQLMRISPTPYKQEHNDGPPTKNTAIKVSSTLCLTSPLHYLQKL